MTVQFFATPPTHLDREIIDRALTLFRFDPLTPSLQGSNPGAKQGDLFFLLLQLDPLFFDFFVGNTLQHEGRRVSGHMRHDWRKQTHEVSQRISVLLARNHIRLIVRHVVAKIPVCGLNGGQEVEGMRKDRGNIRHRGHKRGWRWYKRLALIALSRLDTATLHANTGHVKMSRYLLHPTQGFKRTAPPSQSLFQYPCPTR